MTSTVASLALILFVPLTLVVFAIKPAERAAAWLLICGVLYLPAAYIVIIPLFPNFDKLSVPTYCVFVMVMTVGRKMMRGVRFDGLTKLFLWLLLVGNIVRVLLNRDDLVIGPIVLAAIDLRTVLTFVLTDTLLILTPMMVGIALGRREDWLRATIRLWVGFTVVYLFLILYEIRMSPQLHGMLYGYFQHSWGQMVRDGGFRPIVFMHHGLAVALFLAVSVILAASLGKSTKIFALRGSTWSWIFLGVLALCHSMAGLVYGVAGMALMKLAGPRMQSRVAVLFALVVATFPITRSQGWFPTEELVDNAKDIALERGRSLEFRFRNEDLLLERAKERPWFGWGGFARYRVFDEETGRDITTVDGHWVIVLGQRGYVGFFALFGLMLIPIFRASRMLGRVPKEDQRLIAGLTLAVVFCAVDLLPNGMFNYLPWLLTGLLMGAMQRYVEGWRQSGTRSQRAPRTLEAQTSISQA